MSSALVYHKLCDQLDQAVEMYQEGFLLPTEFATIVAQLSPKLNLSGGVRVTASTGQTYTDVAVAEVWN